VALAVDGDDFEAARGEEPRVASGTARNIEHRAADD
jgi:hypothetical protein